MAKTSIDEKLNLNFADYYKLLCRYPILVQLFREHSPIIDLTNQWRTEQIIQPNPIKKRKITKTAIIKAIKYQVDFMTSVELEIVEQEQKKDYEFKTHYFYIEDVLKELKNFSNISEKINYLNYLLKEYPDHLIRRMNIANEKHLEKLQTDYAGYLNNINQNREIIEYVFEMKPLTQFASMPIPELTFEEKSKQELIYLYQSLDLENKYPQQNNQLNLGNIKIKFNGDVSDLVRIIESMKISGLIDHNTTTKQIVDNFVLNSINPVSAYNTSKSKIYKSKISKASSNHFGQFVKECSKHLDKNNSLNLADELNY